MHSSASIPRPVIRIRLRLSTRPGKGSRRERHSGTCAVAAVDADPVFLGADVVRGRSRRARCRRRAAVHGSDRVRRQLVRRPKPRLVRRPMVVDRRHRRGRCPCRPPPPVDPPARPDIRPDCRPAGRTRRPTPGPADRGRLGRVPHRRRQPRPGKGARLDRRRRSAPGSPGAADSARRTPRPPPSPASAAPTADCSPAP